MRIYWQYSDNNQNLKTKPNVFREIYQWFVIEYSNYNVYVFFNDNCILL